MTGIEIVLLAAGAITFTLSFMLPSSGDEDEGKSEKSSSLEKKVESMNSTDEQEIRRRVRQIADDEAEEAGNTTKRNLEKMTNEKIMAVDEYSKTVLDAIEKNHQEVVFLYDMLNNKSADLKNTIRKAEQTKREVEAERKAEEERAAQITKAAKALKVAEAEKEKIKADTTSNVRTETVKAQQEPVIMPSPEEIESGIAFKNMNVRSAAPKPAVKPAPKAPAANRAAAPRVQSAVKAEAEKVQSAPKAVQHKAQTAAVKPAASVKTTENVQRTQQARTVQRAAVKPAEARPVHSTQEKHKASSEEAMEKLLESMSTAQVQKRRVSAMDRLKKQVEPEVKPVEAKKTLETQVRKTVKPVIEEFEPMPAIEEIELEMNEEPVNEQPAAEAEPMIRKTVKNPEIKSVTKVKRQPVLEAAPKVEAVVAKVSEPDMAAEVEETFEQEVEEVYSNKPVSLSLSGLSRNEQVLEMHHHGKSSIEIAKALAMGVGEVNLVIGLYDKSGREGR